MFVGVNMGGILGTIGGIASCASCGSCLSTLAPVVSRWSRLNRLRTTFVVSLQDFIVVVRMISFDFVVVYDLQDFQVNIDRKSVV